MGLKRMTRADEFRHQNKSKSRGRATRNHIAVDRTVAAHCYLRPAGTGCRWNDDNWPVLVEIYEGRPQVIIWADINKEDPTHEIDLSGALEVHRDNDND